MSEQTGATDEQIEADVFYRVCRCCNGTGTDAHESHGLIGCERCSETGFEPLPPSYRIVPADAVVVTPEIAVTAAEACEGMAERDEDELAENEWSYAPKLTATIRNGIAANRAAAAALRGEG